MFDDIEQKPQLPAASPQAFLPPAPMEKEVSRSHAWSKILGLSLLCIGVLVAGGFSLASNYDDFKEETFQRVPAVTSLSGVREVARRDTGELMPEPPAPPPVPELAGELISTEQFSASAILVEDAETGTILYEKNADEPWPLASITKLMSALVILDAGPDWDATSTVIGGDQLGTHMYAGDVYSFDDLWYAGLVASSNKAMLTFASSTGPGQEQFLAKMNQKASELGMGTALFADPTGLDAANVASAKDVALLLEEAMTSDKLRAALLTPEYTLYSVQRAKTHHMYNTNWILLGWITNELPEFRGGKTGYIAAAGYNFVMQVADEEGHIINVVILGANAHEARFTEARDIAEWVFANYHWPIDESTDDLLPKQPAV